VPGFTHDRTFNPSVSTTPPCARASDNVSIDASISMSPASGR
jgi:hypothetical protein